MSSSPFDRDSDTTYHFEGAVDTASLDWTNLRDIKAAYVKGIGSCPICQVGMELLGKDNILRPQTNKAADEMATLMHFISKQYPQLTQHVLATIYGTMDLIEAVLDEMLSDMPDDEWE